MTRVITVGDVSMLALMREVVRRDLSWQEVVLIEHIERLAERAARLSTVERIAVEASPTVAGERASLVILDDYAKFEQPILPTIKVEPDPATGNRHERRAAAKRRRKR